MKKYRLGSEIQLAADASRYPTMGKSEQKAFKKYIWDEHQKLARKRRKG